MSRYRHYIVEACADSSQHVLECISKFFEQIWNRGHSDDALQNNVLLWGDGLDLPAAKLVEHVIAPHC